MLDSNFSSKSGETYSLFLIIFGKLQIFSQSGLKNGIYEIF